MHQAPPAYDPNPGVDNADKDDRFHYETTKTYNDVFWAILFFVHLAGMIALAVAFGPELLRKADQSQSNTQSSQMSNVEENLGDIIGVFLAAAAGGAIAAALWMVIAKRYADSIVKLSFGFSIGMNLFFAVVSFASGAALIGFLFLLFAGLTALYFYWVRHRIRFAAVMLELSVNVIQDYSGPIYVTFLFVFLEIGWLVFWAFTFLAILDRNQTGNNQNLAAFALLISYFWTVEVLKNVVHVTTAGVAATWWYFPEPRSPTTSSLKRATTTSFGSICLGSLIVAVISAVKATLDAAARDQENSCAQECLRCIVGCIEDLAKFFNVYAFSRVAIYGDSFITAGKDTWQLFKSRGFDLIVNDDLTGAVLGLGALFGFCVSGAIGAGLAAALNVGKWEVFGVIAGIIGFFIVFLVMNVLRSCVATFFITWAEDPAALQQSRPAMYSKLSDAVHRLYPDFRSGF